MGCVTTTGGNDFGNSYFSPVIYEHRVNRCKAKKKNQLTTNTRLTHITNKKLIWNLVRANSENFWKKKIIPSEKIVIILCLIYVIVIGIKRDFFFFRNHAKNYYIMCLSRFNCSGQEHIQHKTLVEYYKTWLLIIEITISLNSIPISQ